MDSNLTLQSIAKMIDHSLLHPTMTDKEIIAGCKLAMKYDVATVCVKPYSIEIAANILQGSDVGICAVIAFPHGNSRTLIKIKEAEDAVLNGATEIDMVVNIGKVLGGDWDYVSDEIRDINKIVISNNAILKVIFENDFLNDEHIIRLCEICSEHKTAFVKTSTGYGFVRQGNGMYSYAGATEHHLKLMRKHCAPEIKIKAAGGIRTLDELLHARELGAVRIGASATEIIMEEAERRGIR